MRLVNPRFTRHAGRRQSVRGACLLNPVTRQTIYTLVLRVHDRTGCNFDGNTFALGTRLVLRRKHETR